MNQKKFIALAGTAAVLLAAGVWISQHRANQQGVSSGGVVLADLMPALGEVTEIRLSKGDGSRSTLRKSNDGWTVVERQYPADTGRVRELALALARLEIIERKTSDPANYPKLGVEPPDTPTSGSTLVEVVAGEKTWPLIVGRGAEGRAVYVRKPGEAASALARPFVAPDPDQKRWIDRLLTDLQGAEVHEVAVRPATGAAYLLTRATRGATDLTLSPVPRGRTAVSSISLSGQTDALTGFHFDDVRTAAAATGPTDQATFRTFDGQVIEFTGHREGEKAYVTVATRRDPKLAAKFAEPTPATANAAPAAPDKAVPAPATTPAADKPADRTVERLGARAKGMEYEIPSYKYEAIFKKHEELLEKPVAPAKKATK